MKEQIEEIIKNNSPEEATQKILKLVVKPDVMCRNSVRWFSERMEAKLAKNDHKGGWKNCELQYLSMRLTQERKELYGALENRAKGSFFGTSHDDNEIIDECADMANFALMIADRFGKNYGM